MKVPTLNSRIHIIELKIIKILMIKIKDVLCIAIIYTTIRTIIPYAKTI